MNTDAICDFYTAHPYPPPVDNLDRARDMWQDENVHRAEFHLFWPHKKYRADFSVLVAGCGTWQAAKFALCHPAARVVGIDVSPTSLKYTEALKRKYNLTNLETRSLPIENAGDLNEQFDHIICTGVLHHLVDPDAGLHALRSVLKADGAMYLMLYAPYGRTGVHMLQDYCRRLGIGTSPQEIKDLTAVLQLLPQHHPLLSMMRGSRDALQADALVDAVLNPRDRTYSVPQLFDFLERHDLRLGRWNWQAPYLPQCSDLAKTPHGSRLAALPEREQYAEMELFRGLMNNHDFVAYRSDGGPEVRFDGEEYLRYVPIRRPWTVCVEERLPPGAAGALINQTHMFHDLFLMIDAREKQMFAAIDGRRSVAEIVDQAEGANELQGVNESQGTNESEGANRSQGVKESEEANELQGANRAKGANELQGVKESQGANRLQGANKSQGANKLQGVKESQGANELQRANRAKGASPRAREFFEKLWWYDQVVFDTSAEA